MTNLYKNFTITKPEIQSSASCFFIVNLKVGREKDLTNYIVTSLLFSFIVFSILCDLPVTNNYCCSTKIHNFHFPATFIYKQSMQERSKNAQNFQSSPTQPCACVRVRVCVTNEPVPCLCLCNWSSFCFSLSFLYRSIFISSCFWSHLHY